jgi:hypothetical protein
MIYHENYMDIESLRKGIEISQNSYFIDIQYNLNMNFIVANNNLFRLHFHLNLHLFLYSTHFLPVIAFR